MTDALPETPHFGFTRVGEGESVSKNGYASQDLDPLVLDKLLWAAFNHHHDGLPALGDPTSVPTLLTTTTVGNLPASTTYYYRVSYVDQYGLETAASPEGYVTTPNPVAPPEAPGAVSLSAGGTVQPGTYSYLVTFVDDQGGETTPSPEAAVQVTSGTTNRVRLTLPDVPTVQDPVTGELVTLASSYRIYRSRPGQSDYFLLASTTDALYDDTGVVEDQTITAPTTNTTNASNGVEVTVPGGFIPLGCVGWRIYRATTSGGYDGNSLVHEVTEGTTNASTIPLTSYIDTGDALLQGFPKNTSSVAPPSPPLDEVTVNVPRGKQVFSAFAPGTITDGELIAVTATPHDISPVKLSATFKTPPSSSTVTIHFADGSGNAVDLACNSGTHRAGDPAGYWHRDFPLVVNGYFEAEEGTLSRSGMTIADDLLAASGQAVQLDTQDDQVEVDFGALGGGDYTMTVQVRVLYYDPSTTNDLVLEVVNTGTNVTLASTTITLDDETQTAYLTLAGPTFTAPSNDNVVLRVRKATSSFQTYYVDTARYTATVVDLVAGTLTVTALVDGTTSAANANVAVWF